MKVVILDRDGVINQDSDQFIRSVDDWRPIAGSLEAMARLNQAGYRIVVASNQSGIGRGLFDYDALFAIHDRLQRELAEHGGHIDAIAFAPEHPDEATQMRKPAPGMLKDLSRRLQFDLAACCFVGDALSDIQAARAAGCRPVLVRTGKGRRTEAEHALQGVSIHDDLASFVDQRLR
ncbi:MAG: D-glycero-beta-D-manno-heptose 1,7-bisphosphate 7-phosphatase [Panacagrimonas sp.]